METSVFEAHCDNCSQKFPVLISEQALQNIVECHMMETGHTVQIREVV